MAQAQLDIILNAQKYQRDLVKTLGLTEKQAAAQALKMARDGQKAADQAARSQQSAAKKSGAAWKTAFQVVSIGAIVAFTKQAATAVFDLTKEVIDLRNEFGDMSTRTGVAAQTLKTLKFASEASGQEFGKLVKIMQKIPKLMADAEGGSKNVKLAFDNLGVKTKTATGEFRDADDVFRDILAGLEGIDNKTTKAARATALLGRAGGDMVVAVGAGAEAFDAMSKFTQNWGANVAPEAIRQAARMQVEMAALNVVTEGYKDQIASLVIKSGSLKGAASVVVFWAEFVKEAVAAAGDSIAKLGEGFDAIVNADSAGGLVNALRQMTKESILAAPISLGTALKRAGENTREFGDNWDDLIKKIDSGGSGGGLGTLEGDANALSAALAKATSIGQKAVSDLLSPRAKLNEEFLKEKNALLDIMDLYGDESEAGIAAANALVASNGRRIREEISLENQAADERQTLDAKRKADAEQRAADEIALARTVSDSKVALAATSANAIGSIAQLMAGKSEASQRRAWAVSKAAGVAESVLNTAMAISNALADVPYPVNLFAAASAGVAGAAAAAQVAATPAPSFYEGGSMGLPYADPRGQLLSLRAHPRETVKIERQGDDSGGGTMFGQTFLNGRQIATSTFEQLRRGGAPAAAMSRIAGRMGHTPAFRSA